MTFPLEKSKVTLGIVPLTDCALIAVAQACGFFARYGLDVTISREQSWASLRDRIMVGALDGAHMLAPMLLAATLGIGTAPFPMVTGLSLGLNGNAVTISNALHDEMIDLDAAYAGHPHASALALKKVVAARRRAGKPLLTFATVFPFSLHNYLLRYWLAAATIHPDRDVRLIVVPPPQMGAALTAGAIDGFCVGGPWNQVTVLDGHGYIAVTGYEIWNNAPEKVFGVSQAWAEQHPNTHLALLSAMIEAAQWLNGKTNLAEAAKILAGRDYVGLDAGIIHASLMGKYHYHMHAPAADIPDYHVFHGHAANFPWVSHGLWVLTQMCRWGQLDASVNLAEIARRVYRPDIFRAAAQPLGLPVPPLDMKPEGVHDSEWLFHDVVLGADRFCDGAVFDPAKPDHYVAQFLIHSYSARAESLISHAG